jgi:predicted PurR-regulated permease PerM
MSESKQAAENQVFQERITQAVIRLALLAYLGFLCLQVLQPFINPIIGGIVIAIALHKPFDRITSWVGGRKGLAAVILVGAILLAIIVPTVALGANLVQTAADLSETFDPDDVTVPPPPEGVADWPLVGERVYKAWSNASRNLESALVKAGPYLKDIGLWVIETMGNLGFGLVMFIVAIVIGGALLPVREKGVDLSHRVGIIVAGKRGPELADLVGASVQSVIRGVIGVAVIQAVAAGLGMLAVGVPGAGLWALLLLLLAVMQLPTLIVLLPVIAYVWSANSTGPAVLFTIWAILVGGSDNVLKPMLMGHGSKTPMLVLFLGSLGGFMAGGILGLFVGAVVLSMGYTVFMTWLEESGVEDPDAVSEESAPESSPESP